MSQYDGEFVTVRRGICHSTTGNLSQYGLQYLEIIKEKSRGKEKREKRKEELPNKWSIDLEPVGSQ